MKITRDHFKLRPIDKDKDASTTLRWRNSERIHANLFTDHIISQDEHFGWLEKICKASIPRFMIFEFRDRPLGIVNATDVDLKNDICHWGFYLGESDVPPLSGTIMGLLGLEYIFEELGIRKICGDVYAFNKASIKFHKKLGFKEEGYFKEHVLKNGTYEDVIAFALFKENWLKIKADIEALCFGRGHNDE